MTEQEATPPAESEGGFTKEELKRAYKAFKRRLKLTRLDEESKLGHGAMTGGNKSSVCAISPPNQYPPEIWDELVTRGRLRKVEHGLYEPASE